MLASLAGGGTPVGYLAAISNPNGTAVSTPRIDIRSDQLNMSVRSFTAASVEQLTVLRLGLDGTITWQTALTDGSDYQRGNSVAIDSAGNAVVAGVKYSTFNSFETAYVVKLNSSGTVQWQKQVNGRLACYGVTLNSSDDIFCAGIASVFSATQYDTFLLKLNSSGTVQYQKYFGNSGSTVDEAYSIAQISSTFLVFAGRTTVGGNLDGSLIFADQAAGALSSAVRIDDTGGALKQEAAVIITGETAQTIYYVISAYSTLTAGYINPVLVKYVDGTGTAWHRQLSNGSNTTQIGSLCMDPTGTYVYAAGFTTPATGTNRVQLSKYLVSSGAVVWQRDLSCPSFNLSAVGIKVDSFDNVYVAIDGATNTALLLKMPGDGSGAGNSVSIGGNTYTYAASTLGDSSPTLRSTAYSPTNSSTGQTVLTPTAASAANTLAAASQPL